MSAERPLVGAWTVGWRLAAFRPLLFGASMAVWVVFHALPLGVGLVLDRVFDRLAGPGPAGPGLIALLAVMAGIELGRAASLQAAIVAWITSWHSAGALLRANLLRAQMASGGPEAATLPDSPGDAVSRFRDDVEDVIKFLDTWLDVAGTGLFAGVAVVIMVRIDLSVTVAVVLPLVTMAVATRALTARIRAWRVADRVATSAVTGFLGELFGSVLSVKAAGASAAALGRLRALNDTRGRAALRDQLCSSLLDSFNASTVDVAIGLVLLLAAPAMRSGAFTVGDLTLFAAYTGQLVWLPYFSGRLLVRRRQTAVSVERMARLLPPGRSADLVTHRPMDLTIPPDVPPAPLPRPAPAAPSASGPGPLLAARGLVATFPAAERAGERSDAASGEAAGGAERAGERSDAASGEGGGRGLLGVDLTLEPGTLTVVSGPIGAGKTTLLRALLGLMPLEAGEVSWHGEPVADLAAWMVPPRCAYVAQVPRLFSESLADNLLLGTAPAPGALAGALGLAVLDEDVAAMPDGVATLVGARGVRLSGGQAQRAAVARALVQGPELLVLDDVSSALDTETEARMWARLLAAGTTCLAVSNRAATMARADQVLAMEGGRLAG